MPLFFRNVGCTNSSATINPPIEDALDEKKLLHENRPLSFVG